MFFSFVPPFKLSQMGGGLTKGVGNHAKKALPTPFDNPLSRETGRRKSRRRKEKDDKKKTENEER